MSGGPIAGDINAYWAIVMDYTLSAAVNFDAVADQWTVNATPVNPLSDFGSICCAVASNPILPGEAYYNSGFKGPLSAGVQSDWQQIFVSPYSFVSAGGIDPSTANGFNFALHFTLQTPVPEPASFALLGVGVPRAGTAEAALAIEQVGGASCCTVVRVRARSNQKKLCCGRVVARHQDRASPRRQSLRSSA